MDHVNPKVQEYLDNLSKKLTVGWEAKFCPYIHRIFYVNHHTQTSHWVPPKENWESTNDNGLPYGHEHALDKTDRTYYINHQDQTTQREDPVEEIEEDPPPEPRDVELKRDPQMGFGFVAGSEKPVIVRFVTEGGPSENFLLPGDWILQINGENVEKAPRERVIELVRDCKETILLTVCQPYSENSGRKSALLTAAKKARLKNNPSRVRFADAVTVNGTSVISPSTHESYIPFMPNVLKVFLENGQTKSFKYDNKTAVREVMDALEEKLNIKCTEHFALVLQNMKSPTQGKMTFLQEHENLAEVAARPGSQHFKCLFRLTFVPRDSYDLVRRDPNAFEYFYIQCTNDVIQERYAQELKYDVALRLASLHIQEHCITNNMSKVSLKVIEKETGFDKFMSESILESMKIKDIRKMLTHYMKVNQNLALPGQKQLTALQTKMHYLKILSEVRSFGGKCFLVTLVEKKAEVMISVGPRQGISLVTNIKNNVLAPLADFDQIEHMTVEKEERETVRRVVLNLKDNELKTMSFVMLNEEVTDFVCLVEGYHCVYINKETSLLVDRNQTSPEVTEVPPYNGKHNVSPASWSYPKDIDEQPQKQEKPNSKDGDSTEQFNNNKKKTKVVDLTKGTPPYHPNKEYVDNVKKSLTLQVEKLNRDNGKKPHAPLASPDISNFSNSSESSNQISETPTPQNGDIVSSIGSSTTSQNTLVAAVTNNDTKNADDEEFSDEEEESSSSHSDSLKHSIVTQNHVRHDTKQSDDKQARKSDINHDITVKDRLPPVNQIKAGEQDRKQNVKRLSTDDVSTPSSTVVLRKKAVSNGSVIQATEMISPGEVPPHTVVLRPKSEHSTRRERPGSFGLHSPDKVPQTEEEIQQLTKEYQESTKNGTARSSTATDVRASYNPKLFTDGGLYLDPDIIDLTFLPPPLKEGATTRDEKLIDFTAPGMTSPPPGFDDGSLPSPEKGQNLHDTSTESGGSIPLELADLPGNIKDRIDALVANDMEIGTQLSAIDALLLDDLAREEAEKESGIDSESDSGTEINEYAAKTPTSPSEVIRRKKKKVTPKDVFSQLAKRQSYQHVDFGADDIDAFIASVTVPPPPKDDPEGFNIPVLGETPKPKLSLSADKSKNVVKKALLFEDVKAGKGNSGDGYDKVLQEDKLTTDDSNLALWFAKNNMNITSVDDDITKLILPPPTTESTEINLDDIRIMPPVAVDVQKSIKTDHSNEVSRDVKHAIVALEKKSSIQQSKPVSERRSSLRKTSDIKGTDIKTGKFIQRSFSNDVATTHSTSNKAIKEDTSNIRQNLVKQLSATVHDKLQNKGPTSSVLREKNRIERKSSASPTRSNSSGSPGTPRKSRPAQPPPPPPSSGGMSTYKRSLSSFESIAAHNKDKIPPPAPPKRFSSLDNSPSQLTTIEQQPVNGNNDSKAVNGPVQQVPLAEPKAVFIMNRSRAISTSNLAAKSSDDSRNLDNSPVHVPIRVVHSLGTLPRFRKKPPPPPPRRSSSTSGGGNYNEMHELSRSVEHIPVPKPKFSTFGPSSGKEVIGAGKSHSNSENSIFTLFNGMPMSTLNTSGNNAVNQEIVAVNTQGSPRSSRLSLSKNASRRDSPTRGSGGKSQRQRQNSTGSSESGSPKMRGKNYVSPKIQAKQNALASAVTRQTSLEEESSSKEGFESPSVNRSQTFTTASTMPRPYTSPKSSPAMHRHSSFSKAADKSPAPFKTFLGETSSSSATATRTSPRVISAASKIEYGAHIQTKDNGVKSVPMKVVRPMVSATTTKTATIGGSSQSPRSSLARNNPPPTNRQQQQALVRTSIRDGSTSSRESTPLQSPRNSLGGGSMGSTQSLRSSVGGVSTGSGHSPKDSGKTSPAATASGGLSAQRRFFPARKVPGPPVPATTPELPASSSVSNVKPSQVHSSQQQQTFTKSLQQAIQQKVASSSPSLNVCYDKSKTSSVLPGPAEPMHNHVNTASSSSAQLNNNTSASHTKSTFDVSQYTINPPNSDQCDIPDEIISKHYEGPRTFEKANLDVDSLVQYLDRSISNVYPHSVNTPDFRTNKDFLVAESRQFVTDSKMLVSSATQNEDKVVQNVNSSIKTLARIVSYCAKTMTSLASVELAQDLGFKVKDVAVSYKMTVNAARIAAGRALSDPNMKALMKQATGLAAILSTLMKTLKVLGQS